MTSLPSMLGTDSTFRFCPRELVREPNDLHKGKVFSVKFVVGSSKDQLGPVWNPPPGMLLVTVTIGGAQFVELVGTYPQFLFPVSLTQSSQS